MRCSRMEETSVGEALASEAYERACMEAPFRAAGAAFRTCEVKNKLAEVQPCDVADAALGSPGSSKKARQIMPVNSIELPEPFSDGCTMIAAGFSMALGRESTRPDGPG